MNILYTLWIPLSFADAAYTITEMLLHHDM
jgi:hypothetical protein